MLSRPISIDGRHPWRQGEGYRRRLWKFATLLRCLEAFFALLLLSWFSAQLPAGFLRHLASALLSPRFVFLLGNAIVLLLLAESGRLLPSSTSPKPSSSSSDLHKESLETSGGPMQSKHSVHEDIAVRVETLACCRIRSEKKVQRRRVAGFELRLTEAEGKGMDEDESSPAEKTEEEGDAEEFRRAVEAFIAKQTRFHREECMAFVTKPLICSAVSPQGSNND
ncbi:hypothetical protein Cni_G07966 [Canna indica]|uniref:DUF4408 domain-containing protein n=1 Tax=Canna indica TaxID=4628 RepID=A0AAQ3K1C0_9LILI|nr:hypothetical protein Cni_G07966 [Canna indica]